MSLILDKKPLNCPPDHRTLDEALKWVATNLPEGKVLTQVRLNGELLDAPAQVRMQDMELANAALLLTSADRKDLSLTTIGKLAALIEWLAPQHRAVAAMLERGETGKGLERLQSLLSAWQQIQQAYANLAKMLGVTMAELRVNDVNGEAVIEEFCHQLGELQTALQNHDFVMLADILQYEMDGAVANWMSILEATLGVVEPVPAA